MKKLFVKYNSNIKRFMITIISIVVVIFATGYIPFKFDNEIVKEMPQPENAEAMYRFDPAGGALIVGTTAPILGATAPSTAGVNVGDWRGAEADDNLHWGFTSTASGYNAYIDIGGVSLRGANKMIIQTEITLKATVPQTYVQICDWVSSIGVNNVADTECTGGGWRTLNLGNTIINSTTAGLSFDWEIYNGYWADTATTSIDTPLSNFINSSKTTRIRYYSTTVNSTSVVNIDYLRVFAVINPTYSASGATVISGGAPLGDYSLTIAGGTASVTQNGSDNKYFRVPGTVATTSNFYNSFNNVKTYAGANTILYRAEYSCSAATAGLTIKPKIYNFSTTNWEDLTTGTINCSLTDATNAWAKSNITIGDYIKDGEIRIGWYGSINSATELRIDMAYMMIGTVNNGTSQVTFGTNSSGTSNDTRDLDMTGTNNTWRIQSADESNTQSFASYANDSDNDVTVEEASAANMDFTLRPPINSSVTGIFFSSRHMSGAAGTVTAGVGDLGGITASTGGWTAVGAGGTTALTYTDNISAATVLSGGAAGLYTNPGNHVDPNTGRMNMRLRTSSAGATTNNSIAQWDFAMLSLQWIENVEHRTGMARFDPAYGALITGTTAPILGATAATTEGVNVGDWRGAEADDNLHWGFTSTASGFNAYIDMSSVALNGANSLIFQTEFDLDVTTLPTYVQVCDWASGLGVSNVADAECTGGGWRNLNIRDLAITSTTPTAYTWQIYNGYWDATATTKIDTPLSNFIDGTGKVRVRYFSTGVTAASLINIDYLRVFAVINPVYFASAATVISGGTPTGNYTLANTAGSGQTGSDNQYFAVPGTAGSLSNFYLSYNDVKTYQGANTILYRAEYSCSTTGINIKPKIYNFTTTLWEDLTTTNIACSATDATNAWAKSDININDYVSGGEVRIGWYGSANNILSVRIDMAYMMIGTVNNGTSAITFGSTSAGTAANTKTLDMNSAVSSWNILSADESNTQSFASYAYDSDNDVTVEEASAANLDFTLFPPIDTQVTGIFFAGRYMSGVAGTVNIGIADAGGLVGAQGGWSQVGANGTTVLTYSDNITVASALTGGAAGWITNPYDFVDAVTGRMNMRLRTSVDGATTNNSVAQWDFAMLSLQWTETPLPLSTISFDISDYSIGFGTLNSTLSTYATDNGEGTTTPSVAHTLTAASNSPGGYVIAVSGDTLNYNGDQISAIGDTAKLPTPSIEQFGINAIASGGYGFVLPPYSRPGYYGFGLSTPNVIAQNIASDNVPTEYSMSYLANIAGGTAAGSYSTVLTYTITATF